MNGASGFQEVRSSISRSSANRLLREQQHRFGTGTWHLLRTHDLITLSTGISIKGKKIADTFSRSYHAIQILGALLLWFTCPPTLSHAQVPPITSSGLNTQVSDPVAVVGQTHYDITGGTRPGGASGTNLFHSFGDFNIPTNNIANFLNAGSVDLAGNPLAAGLPTSNILARVTGSSGNNPTLSSIYGTLQTTNFPGANLFLMNPAGFLFGPNATVNVGGMVAFTSADYLKLTGNAQFNAIPNVAADALLTALPVASFGFLGSNPGAITVQGSQFSVTDEQSISLVGGTITIESGTPEGGTAQPARLSAPNGTIQLASAASPGEFDAATLRSLPNAEGASFISFGVVTLASGSSINVSGTNTVSIRGGQFVLSVNDAVLSTANSAAPLEIISLSPNSSIISSNVGTDFGADVQIISGNLQMDGSSIKSTTMGDGAGGNISISGQTVSLMNGAQIVSGTSGANDGGNITVAATESVTISGFDSTFTLAGIPNLDGFVTSEVFTTTSSRGAAGSATIDAPMVSLDGGGSLVSQTTGSGQGGNLTVTGDQVVLSNGGTISSLSGEIDPVTLEARGSGQGGDISVTATESVQITGVSLDVFTASGILSRTLAEGKSGDIRVTAPNVVLENSSFLSTTSHGTGAAGSIAVNASYLLSVVGIDENFGVGAAISTSSAGPPNGGAGGSIDIYAQTLLVEDGGSIGTTTGTSNAAGNITITGDNFTIRRGAIGTGGGLEGGSAGTIILNASETITISEPFSSDFPVVVHNIQEGSGSQGDIVIQAREILVTNGAEVFSSSKGTGAGKVTLEATDSITVSANGAVRAFGGTTAERPAIDLHAPNIILDQGLLSSRTNVEFDGGSITLNATAGNLTLVNDSHILTNTQFSSGNAGSIVANATDSIVLSGGSTMESSSVGAASGNGGAVRLAAGNQVSLSGIGTGVFSTSAGSGNGGIISVHGNYVQVSDGAVVSAKNTGSGAAGNVTVAGPQSPAQSVLIDGAGSGIFTDTQGTGAGGNILVNADTVTLQNEGTLSANTTGAGNAGEIFVQAHDVSLSGFSLIFSDTRGDGQAGRVRVAAEESISLTESAIFSGTTSVSQTASGGQINLTAPLIDMTMAQLITLTTGPAPAGDITVATNELNMKQESEMNASTSGPGRSGGITIRGMEVGSKARDVTISGSSFVVSETLGDRGPAGNAGNLLVETARLTLEKGGSFRTSSRLSSPGNAGTVTVNASESVRIMSGSGIESNSIEHSTGNAGEIKLTAPVVTVEGNSFLSTSTELTGNAGPITIRAGEFRLSSGGRLSSSSVLIDETPTGAAGSVIIQGLASPAQSVLIDGPGSGIFTDTQGTGAGGNIFVNANSVTLQNGGTLSAATSGTDTTATGGTITLDATNTVTMNSASITASSTGTADAGSINLTAANGFTMQNSTITTQAGQGAGGGNIKVTTAPSATVLLETSRVSASVADGTGGGGNISIDPQFVILQNSQILAQAAQGQGGTITIITNLFLPDANSIVNADSGSGVNGTVTIQSPNAPISGQIQPLGATPLIATSLLNQHCAAVTGGQFSSFTVAGRDSLPTVPGSWLTSPLYAAGTGLGIKAEGGKTEGERLEGMSARAGQVASGQWRVGDIQILSLRQIAPAGFLTQAFAVDEPAGCQS